MASTEGVKYTCPQHAKKLLQNLQELRHNKALCDFTLVIDGVEIPVQRNMLAAGSPYFRSLFNYDVTTKSTRSLKVNLAELNVASFDQILEYIYTSEITLNDDNIQNIFQAADVLLMSDLKQLCAEYLENCISPANCLGIINFTEQYCCPRIRYLATQCMENSFRVVSLHEEFLQQPFDKMKEILSSDKLQVGNIDSREEVIFEAALRWIQHDTDNRKQHFENLMRCVHFHHLSSDYYTHVVLKDEMIASNKSYKDLVKRLYHTKPCTSIESTLRGYYDVIVVAGGEDSQNTCVLPTVRCLHPQRPQWIDLPSMLTPRMQHGLTSAGGYLFANGGIDNEGQILNTGEKYDPDTNTWSFIAPMIHGRYGHNLVAIDNHIYAVGGYEEDVIHTMEAYDIYKNTWEEMPSMQISRQMTTCATMQKKIYVIGGCLKHKLFDTVECFDTVTKTWSLICPIMEQRFCATAVGTQNKLFLFGGLRNLRCPSAQHQMKFCGTEIYNSKLNAWTGHYEAIPSRGMCTMSTSSRLMGAVHIDGYIYVIGCLDTGGNYQCIRCCHDDDLSPWYSVMEHFPSNQRDMVCTTLRICRSLYYRMARETDSKSGTEL
ncbi:gigaxonin-like [Glandiceps talaboti]